MRQQRGQVALLLVLAMAVMGVVTVSVASRGVEGLRTVEIDRSSQIAFNAAEAGLEQATLQKTNVSGSLSGGNVSYNATYNSSGENGLYIVNVETGDVVSVSVEGASGGAGTTMRIYWNGNTAVKISDISGDSDTAMYSIINYTSDPNTGSRSPVNNFTSTVEIGNFFFQGQAFGRRISIPVNLSVIPVSKLIRVSVLYQSSDIGVEPVGFSLPAGQLVSVSSTGSIGNLKSKVTQQRFMEKLPAIFDNVLYTEGSLTQ